MRSEVEGDTPRFYMVLSFRSFMVSESLWVDFRTFPPLTDIKAHEKPTKKKRIFPEFVLKNQSTTSNSENALMLLYEKCSLRYRMEVGQASSRQAVATFVSESTPGNGSNST